MSREITENTDISSAQRTSKTQVAAERSAETVERARADQVKRDALVDSQLLYRLAVDFAKPAEPQEIYERVMDTAVEVMHSDYASMQMLVPERGVPGSGGELRLLAYRGFTPEAAQFWERVRADSVSTCGMALRSRTRCVVPDVETCAFMTDSKNLATFSQTGIRAAQSTPLLTRSGDLIGVMSTHWRMPHEPSERDFRVFDVLARHAADILERNQAEQEHARLAAIVASSDDAIISKDLNGIMQTWNAGAQRLFGYTADEAVGQSVTLLFPPERVDEEEDVLRRIGRGERIEHFETVRRCKNGGLLDVSLTISPVTDASGKIVGASKIARDITEQRRTEQALREVNRRKDEFLATLAHELRNPLVPLRNGLEVMRQRDPETTEKARALMAHQLSQLTHLVDDLMDVSRITRGKVELRMAHTDLSSLVRKAVQSTHSRVDSAGHALRVTMPDEPVTLWADADRLMQATVNLIINAAKYTPVKGRIEVDLETRDNIAVVCVRDNGMGIATEQLATIFDMFGQADQPDGRMNEGLGIGLTLARQVVELHGGTVEARSEGIGQGAEFTVQLPLTADEPSQVVEDKPVATPSCSLRLLVVDDNQGVSDSMALMLETWGHEIHIAEDGYEALAAVPAFQPDAIFLDIGLPGIDGFETARRLRVTPEGGSVLLIALTGWGDEKNRSRTAEAGFDHHLVKPVEPDVLEQLLAELKPQGVD